MQPSTPTNSARSASAVPISIDLQDLFSAPHAGFAESVETATSSFARNMFAAMPLADAEASDDLGVEDLGAARSRLLADRTRRQAGSASTECSRPSPTVGDPFQTLSNARLPATDASPSVTDVAPPVSRFGAGACGR